MIPIIVEEHGAAFQQDGVFLQGLPLVVSFY